ncbi:uncharacterized protein ANIA_06481 [Aspergillus nidulans FGSC A4]|uniref:Uncharacterized protein n=1 Tax=Emericella nidulans (strain FGSC A4 / ATCC 38163 / CBS 112.46 / NRRL 194 / M139) TaxID=227321 RepID=C8V043_EMENI|nr:hypothetical protein [Aspergillus nidulans FGSC A4]CBF69369.1 TPA: conserved hypothetical protein [Aspergillus nidulans FGSC A4]
MRNVGRLGIPSDHYSDSESETEEITITPHLLPYDPSPGIDSLFARLDQARDECCAMFRSNEDEDSSAAVSGLGLIVTRMMESVLKGHSTCKEMPDLNIGEVYATYTNALQLEARNHPSKNLLLDINLLREELETIIANIVEQLKLITGLRDDSSGQAADEGLLFIDTENINFELLFTSSSPSPSPSTLNGTASNNEDIAQIDLPSRAILQAIHAELHEQEEVFTELIKRANILERQIVQRVDIIQEDHGKAILVFTIVSVIFLPLSFVSSYLGMNTADIRDMKLNQALFWQVALPVTVVVVALVLVEWKSLIQDAKKRSTSTSQSVRTANGQLHASVVADSRGICNGILSTLYTNVAYFDQDSGSMTEDWKLWSKRILKSQPSDERWTPGRREGDPNASVFGRLARYPHAVPHSEGIDETGSMALNNFELGTTTGTTALHVFCAVNLFNQPDIYHFGTYNWVLLRHEQGAEQDVAEYWF